MKPLIFALGLALLPACGGGAPKSPTVNLSVRYFSSCSEIGAYRRRVTDAFEEASEYDGEPDRVALQADASGGAESHVNLQESDVDEADFFRISPSQLFYAGAKAIEVVQRANLQHLGALPTSSLENVMLYTDGPRLIVVAHEKSNTKIEVYESDVGSSLPVKKGERTFPGHYSDTRYVEGRLLVIMPTELVVPETDARTLNGTRCTSVTVPPVEDTDFRATKVLSLSPADLNAAPKEVVVSGLNDKLYMTKNHLYLAKSYFWWPSNDYDWDKSVIAKVSFDSTSGEVKLAALGEVRGIPKDRWAFKEYASQDALAIATTTRVANHFSVLQQRGEKLEVVNSVEAFAPREDIRAVRYVDDMAYVVTFEKTDPLFAIDMSSPLAPVMRGELKIPGFSVYLHPIARGRLVGLGFDADDVGAFSWAQGIQLSLFDTSDPMKLSRLDVKVFGRRGSSSEAANDAHAFYADPAAQEIAFPLSEVSGDSFTGAVLYSSAGDKLTERARFTHERWRPAACDTTDNFWSNQSRAMDINRVTKLDGRLLTVSQFGLVAYQPSSPQTELAAIAFRPAATFCDRRGSASMGAPILRVW